tara:strand:- start:102 stop:281 length:180 start_codon:yes stop_codon:yes gene_type:complete
MTKIKKTVKKITITATAWQSKEEIHKLLSEALWDGSVSYEIEDFDWTIEDTGEEYKEEE